MAKKTSKKDKAAGSSAGTLCEQGGNELTPMFVRLSESDVCKLHVWLCKSPGRAVAELDQTAIFDQDVTNGKVEATLPPLAKGFHLLLWSVLPTAAKWQVRSEVDVNGTALFRHRKSEASDIPTPRWFIILEVV